MKKASKKAGKAPRPAKPAATPAPVKKTDLPAAPSGRAAQAGVKITPAKGRPMLTWVGKRPVSHVIAFPAQHVESFDPTGSFGSKPASPDLWKDWPAAYPKGGLLFHGDNKEVLAHLLANGFRGKVNLIYIDPPFDSGADYVRKVSLRGAKGTAKLDGESYTLGEQIQYTDIWANDNYLQFMYERLMLLRETLSESGSLFLHCDETQSHRLRCLLDEVFGPENFQNELIWYYTNKYGAGSQAFDVFHNSVFWYSKGKLQGFSPIRVPVKQSRQQPLRRWNKELGKNEWLRGPDGKYLYKESKEKDLGDVWEIPVINPMATERSEYPTQKPELLLEYILKCASQPGDLVLDCFIGSGTTATVAQKFGSRWIGCDINKGAIQTTAKRLQTIIQEQMDAEEEKPLTLPLSPEGEREEEKTRPTQLAFTVWRVNDYDLAIQHNEAVNLACEHIGIQRTRTDAFFDGTLGKALVKIIPFGHPLTPLDLEELKRELDARPDEDRPITLVCLGMELAAKAWIEDWNRLRKGKDAINKIQVIELRTDPKYGKFIKHEPARAKVKIAWKNGKLTIEIVDFISPTILERLAQQAGLLKPKIDDWRGMVDCVMIDPAYDGKVFNVALSDVPEKKTDLVTGRYELPAQNGKATVAVKIIDMLGEEVLVTQEVSG